MHSSPGLDQVLSRSTVTLKSLMSSKDFSSSTGRTKSAHPPRCGLECFEPDGMDPPIPPYRSQTRIANTRLDLWSRSSNRLADVPAPHPDRRISSTDETKAHRWANPNPEPPDLKQTAPSTLGRHNPPPDRRAPRWTGRRGGVNAYDPVRRVDQAVTRDDIRTFKDGKRRPLSARKFRKSHCGISATNRQGAAMREKSATFTSCSPICADNARISECGNFRKSSISRVPA